MLVSWNGLMIEALARSGAALDEPRYVDAAAGAARFLLSALRSGPGRLLHVWRAGQVRVDAFLDDYASLANALVSLYEARFEERWIDEAAALADEILLRFHDPAEGGFFYTAAGHESLIARKKDMLDSSLPSGGGLATMALLRLGKLCGRSDYLEPARQSLRACATLIERRAMGSGQMLLALDFDLAVDGGNRALRRRRSPGDRPGPGRAPPGVHPQQGRRLPRRIGRVRSSQSGPLGDLCRQAGDSAGPDAFCLRALFVSGSRHRRRGCRQAHGSTSQTSR